MISNHSHLISLVYVLISGTDLDGQDLTLGQVVVFSEDDVSLKAAVTSISGSFLTRLMLISKRMSTASVRGADPPITNSCDLDD